MHVLLNNIKNIVDAHPDRLAIFDKDGRKCTYGQLSILIDQARIKLIKKGVKKGTKAIVAVPMSIELYVILLALFSLGGIAVFLDPWMKGRQMERIIKKVRAEILVISSKLKWLAFLLPATWKIKNWWSVKKIDLNLSNLINNSWTENTALLSDNDIALITFTSGTSGFPKGADRSFGFLSAQLKALKPHLESSDASCDFTNFPIVGLADLALGNTVVVPNVNLMKIHRADPSKIATHLAATKTTRLIVSPSLLERSINGLLNSENNSDLHTVITGGAPIPYSLIEKCLTYLPEIHFEAIFGSTEAEPIATTDFQSMKKNMDDPLKGVFVGKPVREIELKIIEPFNGIIDASLFDNLCCKNGCVGELVVTGDHVNKNYFENEQAFLENKIADKNNKIWHRTGDIGYISENGLYLVGRLSRIINKGGESFHPYPIEFFLEREFGLKDTGYIQTDSGDIALCIGGVRNIDIKEIKGILSKNNYPFDFIKIIEQELPRDPRHKSKLDAPLLLKKIQKK